MPNYKIKHTSIMHNGKLCKEGDTIELTKEQAARLEDFVILIPEKKTAIASTENGNKTKTTTKNKTAQKTETKTEVKDGETNVQ